MNNLSVSRTVKTPEQFLALRARAQLELRRRQNLGLKQTYDGIHYSFHGANLDFHACRATEFMLSGPAQTGKTITGLALLNNLAIQHPGSQWAIVRKVRADMDGSVLQIFKDKVLGPQSAVHPYGGEKPEFYAYPNKSRIWVGGMDRPGKVLSGERDGVYVNQAEELAIQDWETLLTRTTGRSGAMLDESGVPYGLLFGDCNPGPPTHWIWSRQLSGKLKFFQSRHQDNPALYDQITGAITEFGRRTMEQLDRLTGYRRSRLRDGLWVQAEGIIFDQWMDAENVRADTEYNPEFGGVIWALDDGYSAGSEPANRGIDPQTGQYVADSHPRVILFCQQRPDGGLNVFDEAYACLTLTDAQLNECLARPYPKPDYAVHGPGSAEIRGRLYAAGIMPRQCKALVQESIREAQDWIGADANGRRLLHVNPRCRHLRSELVSYAYDPGTPDKPAKQFDHGPDALRYVTWDLRHER